MQRVRTKPPKRRGRPPLRIGRPVRPAHPDESELLHRALSDATRRRILDLLSGAPRTTGAIAAEFPRVSRFAIMKHLAVLEEANIVLPRRHGRERWNHLNAAPLRRLYERWVGPMEDRWAGSMLSIARVAETESHDKSHEGVPAMPVTETAPPTFRTAQVELEMTIKAPRARVWEAITRDIDKWFAFRSMKGAVEMVLELHAGGRLFERAASGDEGLWGTVLEVRKPSLLRIADNYASFNPGAFGSWALRLEEKDGATVLKFSQHIAGNIEEKMRASLDSGWKQLFDRHLREYVEKGIAQTPSAEGCE